MNGLKEMLATVILLTVCGSLYGQTADEILSLAVKSSGIKIFEFANIEFEADINDPPLTPERLAALVARQEEGLRFALETYKDQPQVLERYEDLLRNNKESVAKQAAEHQHSKIVGVYRRFGPHIGGDVLYELNVKKGSDYAFDAFLLQRQLGEKNVRSVNYDLNSRQVIVSSTGASVGIIDPILIGRLSGRLLSMIESGTEFKCSVDSKYFKKNPGEQCIKLTSKIPVSTGNATEELELFGKIVVDTDRDYICPLVEFSTSLDGLVSRVSCSDYFQVGTEKKYWFPENCLMLSKEIGGEKEVKLRFRPSNIQLNQSLASDLFTINVPAGVHFLYRLGQPRTARSACEVKIDIDGLDSLMDHRCLRGGNSQAAESSRAVFIYVSAILILVSVLYFRFRAKAK